jgi:putative ABC transport system ATP-binding protein
VFENVELPLTYRGMKSSDRKQRVEAALERVGMAHRAKHLPSQLSGGQQQRVAVARALVSKPAVVFADEPTGNLDSKSSEEVLGMLRRSVDDLGQTVVMVSHDPEAASHADRLIVLRDGLVVHDGSAGSAEDVIELMKAVA